MDRVDISLLIPRGGYALLHGASDKRDNIQSTFKAR